MGCDMHTTKPLYNSLLIGLCGECQLIVFETALRAGNSLWDVTLILGIMLSIKALQAQFSTGLVSSLVGLVSNVIGRLLVL